MSYSGDDNFAAGTSGPHELTIAVPLPTVLPGAGRIVEGTGETTTMEVGVRLSAASTEPVTVQWTTLQLTGPGYADGFNDYTPATGDVTFAPGETRKTVSVTVDADAVDELDEYVFVSYHTPTNAVIGGFYGFGYGIIHDDDEPPAVIPGLTASLEGDTGPTVINVPVSLSAPSGQTVTVDWGTVLAAGVQFATIPEDYTPATGLVTFAPGETTKTVPVAVNGDIVPEPDEYIVVSFRNATNATIGGFYGLGFAAIQNND